MTARGAPLLKHGWKGADGTRTRNSVFEDEMIVAADPPMVTAAPSSETPRIMKVESGRSGLSVDVIAITGTTETSIVPTFPSLRALIVTGPYDSPVTAPLSETIAIFVSLDAQATGRPERRFPAESRTIASNRRLRPCPIWFEGAATCTDATGPGMGTTVTRAVPVRPSLVAPMVVSPTASAEMIPAAETEATAEFVLCHSTTRFLSTLPSESRRVTTA